MKKENNNFIQSHWRSYTIILLTLGALWIILTTSLVPIKPANRPPSPQVGFSAPDFELTTLDNKNIRLSDMVGKVFIINFWATWCGPCQAEMPAMQSVYEKWKIQGLEILAVNSTIQDDPQSAAQFALERRLTFPILLDTNGSVSRQFQVRALPTTFIVDRSGIIHNLVVGGPINEAFLYSQVEALLAGGR